MGVFAFFKGNKALRAHNKGDTATARKLYEEAYDCDVVSARVMLGYAYLLIYAGEYEKAIEVLKKAQTAPDLTPERRSQLFVDYAACCARTNQLDRGVRLLERQHDKVPTGLTYQTLGYLYVEQLVNKPVADETTEITLPEGQEMPEEGLTVEEKQRILDQQWQEKADKAHELLKAAIDYDDECPVCQDNMGQFIYRVLGDAEAAKPWFEKAHELKPHQVDSLWFLSRYDLEKGNRAEAIKKLETALEGRMSPLNYANKEMLETELARLSK